MTKLSLYYECKQCTLFTFIKSNKGKKLDSIVKKNLSKVPELSLIFWIFKIAATTLGETAGDAVSMSMNLGYLIGTLIFAVVFLAAVVVQINAKKFSPLIYWTTIVATTTVGTTLADFATRSLGIGYAGGSTLLFGLLLGSLFVWYKSMGTVSVESIRTPKAEMFYWLTIMFSQTLGTALGDWTADSVAMGYLGAAVLFGGLLLALIGLYLGTKISRTFLFWSAFILTRPLGAVLGDFIDKPIEAGGLALSRYSASAVLFVIMFVCILIFKQRANAKAH